MGIIFTALSFVWMLILTLMISYFSKLFIQNEKVMKWIDKFSGLVFLGMGLKLALTSKD